MRGSTDSEPKASSMTSDRNITPDMKIGTATFLVGWELSELLAAEYGEKAVFSDEPLIGPGHTIPVAANDIASIRDVAARMLPSLLREIAHQLDELGLAPSSPEWSVEFDYLGHPTSGCGTYVGSGIRFDAMVNVRDRPAADDTPLGSELEM